MDTDPIDSVAYLQVSLAKRNFTCMADIISIAPIRNTLSRNGRAVRINRLAKNLTFCRAANVTPGENLRLRLAVDFYCVVCSRAAEVSSPAVIVIPGKINTGIE